MVENFIKPSFSPKSMRDGFGRVFFENGQVYRAITISKTESCRKLINSELFKKLSEKKWIPETIPVDKQIDGYGMVLHHEKLQEILQHEWSFDMLKDAGLLIWDINQLCNEHGYELKDAHTLNIMFRGTTPVLSDIGSITEKSSISKWFAKDEFICSFVMPLLCWSRGLIYITRKLLGSHFYQIDTLPSQTVGNSGIPEMIPDFPLRYNLVVGKRKLCTLLHRVRFIEYSVKSLNKMVSALLGRPSSYFKFDFNRGSISEISPFFKDRDFRSNLVELNAPRQFSAWQTYHKQFYSSNNEIKFSDRFIELFNLIKNEGSIRSVIDLAGNEGYFCSLLAKNSGLEKIILTDYDENAINSGYLRMRENGDLRIHTALLNFMFTQAQEDSQSRLRCNLAVALAVTHHLLLGNHFSLHIIFERVAAFSSNYVLIEFMPLGLWAEGEEVKPLPGWYNVEWFRENFEMYFELISERQTEPNRIYFFGRKK